MSRSGYSDDCDDNWAQIKWRGQVMSAIRGKRGQSFLKELIGALEAMPTKRLIANELVENGEVCALGAVGRARGMDLDKLDPHDYEILASEFGIAHQLVREIEWENDEHGGSTPEERWRRVHKWANQQLKHAEESEPETKTHIVNCHPPSGGF